MSRLGLSAARIVVLAVLLGACISEADGSRDPEGAAVLVDVDVDTPQLRAIKKEAGVEPCPRRNAWGDEGGDEGGDAAASTDGMPDIVLSCLGGGPDADLGSMTGPLVVNLWAQWCGPCREELPYYQRLHEEAGGKVRVLGIDYQDTRPRAALELVREAGVTFPLLADPAGQVRVPFEVRGLPGVLLVDRDGRIAHTEYVVIRSYDQLRDLVQQHLGVTL